MLKKVLICFVAPFVAVIASGAPAKADSLTFNLTNNTCASGFSPSPFGYVTISNDGQPADTVLVTETLTGATGFVSTAAGYALASMSLAIPRSPSPV